MENLTEAEILNYYERPFHIVEGTNICTIGRKYHAWRPASHLWSNLKYKESHFDIIWDISPHQICDLCRSGDGVMVSRVPTSSGVLAVCECCRVDVMASYINHGKECDWVVIHGDIIFLWKKLLFTIHKKVANRFWRTYITFPQYRYRDKHRGESCVSCGYFHDGNESFCNECVRLNKLIADNVLFAFWVMRELTLSGELLDDIALYFMSVYINY